MQDLKSMMREHYLKYASYVILDRAIPNVADGLKPVQRRILHTLFTMHDGKFHKVANVVGQTMAYHPHGDAAIYEALVNIGLRGFLLDTQGNFGNMFTGDPAAAARYIETRLSPLAREVLFNPSITKFLPSYDGRNSEPVTFPAKIPLTLLLGAEGIAVGMSTKVLPHNFVELIEAEIAILEDRPFEVLPDFPTGGIMDASEYDGGKGKIKLRAKIEVKDPKTLVIRDLCYGTTTESLINSIDDAAKRGKIKIDSISDYTTEKVEIEIKLPRGQYAEDVLDHLYHYTECQVNLVPQMILIKDNLPVEMRTKDILHHHVDLLLEYLKAELQLEEANFLQSIFEKTLEQIFIENRLYKHIEESKSSEEMYTTLQKSIKPYHDLLARLPEEQDYERLLQIPIRRIARFDIQKNQEDIQALEKKLTKTRGHLKKLKPYAVNYLNSLITRFGKDFARKTEIQQIATIDKKAIETKEITVGFDPKTGYIGTKVTGAKEIACTNFDKLIVFYKSGVYKVINIPEKQYIGKEKDPILFCGIADKKTVFNVCFQDPKTGFSFAKRFIVKAFILEKEYNYFDEGGKLQYFSSDHEPTLLVQLLPKARQKVSSVQYEFKEVAIKGVAAHGIKMAARPVMEINPCASASKK
ncbi:MAG: DNA topoisomerase IV subunit A [Verrucomicrobia bacterium]|nr:DNA topoisomerase IV subunit A [Verrucomicrobiota bacterium]MBS0635921.1 DNA topoisomerase IV subunit A [Verrucomicrobiota bacterium]